MRVAFRNFVRLAHARPGLSHAPSLCVQSPAFKRARFSTEKLSISDEISSVSTKGNSIPSAATPASNKDASGPVQEAKSQQKGTNQPKTLHIAGVDTGIELTEFKKWSKRSDLSGVWLRDNCRCPHCVNQDTLQKTIKTFDIPLDIKPKSVIDAGKEVHVVWPDGHESRYAWEFIKQYTHTSSARKYPFPSIQFHDPSDQLMDKVTTTYDTVMSSDKGVGKLTRMIKIWGFAIVYETPYDDPLDTKKLLERIGPIRETHYGGFYDFTPDLSKADTAYTNLALAPHTDTTYFTDPAGLQAFHLLSHTPAPGSKDTEVTGGKSLLVDGFRAAKILQETMPPWYYEELQRTSVPWHASGNEGVTISPRQTYPVFERARDTWRDLQRIRWNNDDRGVLPLYRNPDLWYQAAGAWQRILDDEKYQIWLQLKPGMTLIFDNWRMLHGRSAFNGVRRICGGYINRDDFISRLRNTNLTREQALKDVIGW